MVGDLSEKKVLVLSDHDLFAKTMALNLTKYLGVKTANILPDLSERSPSPVANDDLDLIILALSSSLSEPIVMLSKTRLTQHIAKVPILIVSDRPFASDANGRFFHMKFPFRANDLCTQVKGILQMQSN
ncbi:MAG: hypothetical protein GY847_07035 [Proteobacteria bacterium]|nr:hypothetical protein [Pseudomonadota bacterium]